VAPHRAALAVGQGSLGTTAALPSLRKASLVNQIFFASKRAFHGVMRVMRKPLRSLGLTAARFDMLKALLGDGPKQARLGTMQSELRRCLGVCASVVSRMLVSLEKLGLVTRRRDEHGGDRRQVWVTLTEAGLKCVLTAFKMLRRPSWRLVHEAICFGRHRDVSARFVHTEKLEGYLCGIREHYGDAASLYYPWHPDD
jgi:DNA-binding MarR family transcriptional regulator